MSDEREASYLPTPSDAPITYDGPLPSASRVVEIWTDTAKIMKPFQDEAKRVRDLRRGTLERKISPTWISRHPEAAAAARSRLPQRRTLEQDLKARLGVVLPFYIRKALGDTERAAVLAQQSQDYLNEWATSEFGVPYELYVDMGVEVGGYLRVRLPTASALEGRPDFFERVSERAYARLDEDEQQGYAEDRAGSKKKPYVRVDVKGGPVPSATYRAILAEPEEEGDLPPLRRADNAKKRENEAQRTHQKAVQRYLLQRQASIGTVYGGLDALPIFKRGTGKRQAILAAAITRQLVTVEEAIEAGYGWVGMGNRLLIPRGASDADTRGRDGCYYLYTLYLTQADEDGIERPLVLYTMGGQGTSYLEGGLAPDSPDAVGLIDLYDEWGLEGPLWSWHWGLKTADDEPAFRGRPYLADLADLILAIEGEEMAIRATTQVSSFTGHVEHLGRALSGPNPEAVLSAIIQAGPNGKELKKFVVPAPGESTTSLGEIAPFQQAAIGRDAWQVLASDRATLAQATAVDQAASAPGASGHAIVVGETLAKVAKRDVQDEALEAFRRDGEDHFKILAAIEAETQICWPIQKVEEPTAGDVTGSTGSVAVAEFDPAWYGDQGQYARLEADFPNEENLAELDLESNLADRGYSHFENVVRKKGITDPNKEWQKVLMWKMRQNPLYLQTVMQRLAARRGDQTMTEVLQHLQQQQQMTEAGLPGASNGVPTAALRRQGEAGPQQAGQPPQGASAASAQRGGIEAGQYATSSQNRDAAAQQAVSQGAA